LQRPFLIDYEGRETLQSLAGEGVSVHVFHQHRALRLAPTMPGEDKVIAARARMTAYLKNAACVRI